MSGRLQDGSQSEDLPFVKGSYPRGLGYGFEMIVYSKFIRFMEKDCPRCGDSFVCRVDDISACHCVPVKLDELQLAYVKVHYPGCLCNSCLNEIKK